jgi:hypothetical protein
MGLGLLFYREEVNKILHFFSFYRREILTPNLLQKNKTTVSFKL